MRPIELRPENQLLLHLAARVYHTTLLSMGQGMETPYAHLREHGLTDETIRRAGIGYASGDLLGPALAVSGLSRALAAELNLLDRATLQWERMTSRLVFLDNDQSGRVLNLIGQQFAPLLIPEAPQYVNLSDAPTLFGYARLDTRPGQRPVLLVETPLDVLIARQWGFDALATLGTQLTSEHIRLLSALPRPLLVIQHSGGQQMMKDVLSMLGKGLVVPLPADVNGLCNFGTKPDGEARFVSWLKSYGYERKPRNPNTIQNPWGGDE